MTGKRMVRPMHGCTMHFANQFVSIGNLQRLDKDKDYILNKIVDNMIDKGGYYYAYFFPVMISECHGMLSRPYRRCRSPPVTTQRDHSIWNSVLSIDVGE